MSAQNKNRIHLIACFALFALMPLLLAAAGGATFPGTSFGEFNVSPAKPPIAPSPVITAVATDSITGTWAAVPKATSYVFDVSTQSTFASYIYQDAPVTEAERAAGGTIPGLEPDTTYYLRVRAVWIKGYGAFSQTISQKTDAEEEPAANTPPTAGMFAWYDAASYTVVAGAENDTWPDGSPNGYDLSVDTGYHEPTKLTNQVNGLPALNFASDPELGGVRLTSSAITFTATNTVAAYYVMMATSTTSVNTYGSPLSYGHYAAQIEYYPESASIDTYGMNDTDGSNISEWAFYPSTSTYQLHSVIFDGSQAAGNRLKLYINGSLKTKTATPSDGDTTIDIIRIIVSDADEINWINGNIAEMLIYTTDSNKSDVETYLNTKYNLW